MNNPRGVKIVLAASTSESSDYLRSTWRQMLLRNTARALLADADFQIEFFISGGVFFHALDDLRRHKRGVRRGRKSFRMQNLSG